MTIFTGIKSMKNRLAGFLISFFFSCHTMNNKLLTRGPQWLSDSHLVLPISLKIEHAHLQTKGNLHMKFEIRQVLLDK